MKYLLMLCAICGFAPMAVQAQGFDLNSALQAAQQMANGQQAGTTGATATTGALGQQAQTAMMQQAMQMMANNPQLLTQMAGSLNSQQQATLLQKTMSVANKSFTPQEQASLNAFMGTPEGASIMAKLPGVIQQLTPVVMQMYAGQLGTVAPAAGK